MREIEELCTSHDQFKATLGEADKEFQTIDGIERVREEERRDWDMNGPLQEIEHIVMSNGLDRSLLANPYTDLSAQDIRR